MRTKVGAAVFADPVARFAVAIPGAIVITLLFFTVWRWQPQAVTPAEQTPPATVVLERPAPTPPPTPRPSPTPPPPTPPPAPRVTLAPVPQRAAPRAVHRSDGGRTAPVAVPHVVTPSVVVAGGGSETGPGTGSGEGAGSAGGSGTGTGGTGNAAITADAPCGSVDLVPYQAPEHGGAITYEHINATVTFPDGHTENADFPYRWAYADPGSDPWSPTNMSNPNFTTRVQLPLPGTDTSRFPDVIRYILDHTRSDGTTVLQECPRQR